MKKVLILAGGFGSRLKSAVSDVPKPLAPVCGKPFLMHLIENYISQGALEFVLLLHYNSELIQSMIAASYESNALLGVKVQSIVEDEPLGTGGSVMNAIKCLNITESFLVVNADTWLDAGFKDLSTSPANSIAAVEVKDSSRYGTLDVVDNKIVRFLEKNSPCNNGLINAGLYHLSPDVFSDFVANKTFSLETEVFPNICKRMRLNMVKVETDFIDIGIPEDYFRFCKWIKSGKNSEL